MRIIVPTALTLGLMATFVNASSITAVLPAASTQSAAVVETGVQTKFEKDFSNLIAAKAYGVFDVETGELLFGQNLEEELPIASVTKLFTAAKVLTQPNIFDESITITESDVVTEGGSGKLEVGQIYKVHNLLFPLLLESSNDAATALVRKVGDITFQNEILADGAGLSAENKASVNELAKETINLYKSEPHLFDITTLSQMVGEYTGWINNSPVRDLEGYRGGKHGYTVAANHTLVAVFAENALDDQEFVYVILGSDDLLADTEVLRAAMNNK